VSPAKAAELIEMLVGLWTGKGGGQRIRSGLPKGRGNLGVGHVPGSEYDEL